MIEAKWVILGLLAGAVLALAGGGRPEAELFPTPANAGGVQYVDATGACFVHTAAPGACTEHTVSPTYQKRER